VARRAWRDANNVGAAPKRGGKQPATMHENDVTVR
jgi:hypothetical protein